MKDGNILPQITKLLKDKRSIAICLPVQTTLDATAGALALYSALVSQGKSVTIAAPEALNQDFGLPGQDQIKTTLSAEGNVLVVSVPFKETKVENVTYTVENEYVNIVIKPEEGAGKFDKSKVQYSYTGGKPDLIIAIYSPTLEALGALYEGNADQFQGVDIINIDRHFTNSQFGKVNFVDKKSPSISQMIFEILRDMRFELSKDVATCLYAGLSSATNSFSAHTVNAQTFKMAATLLDRGATKPQTRPPGFTQQRAPSMNPFMTSSMPGPSGFGVGQPPQFDDDFMFPQQFGSQVPYPTPAAPPAPHRQQAQQNPQRAAQHMNPNGQAAPQRNQPAQVSHQSAEASILQEAPVNQPGTTEQKESYLPQSGNTASSDPQDWLKPQIFGGGQGTSRT